MITVAYQLRSKGGGEKLYLVGGPPQRFSKGRTTYQLGGIEFKSQISEFFFLLTLDLNSIFSSTYESKAKFLEFLIGSYLMEFIDKIETSINLSL